MLFIGIVLCYKSAATKRYSESKKSGYCQKEICSVLILAVARGVCKSGKEKIYQKRQQKAYQLRAGVNVYFNFFRSEKEFELLR